MSGPSDSRQQAPGSSRPVRGRAAEKLPVLKSTSQKSINRRLLKTKGGITLPAHAAMAKFNTPPLAFMNSRDRSDVEYVVDMFVKVDLIHTFQNV